MKKLISLLLALTLILAAVPAVMAEGEPVRIVFWHSMSDEAGLLMDQFVADFNAGPGAEAGIVVEAVYQGAYADATVKLNSILNAGNTAELPDVMQLDATGKVNYAAADAAYTVDKAQAEFPVDLSAMLPAAMGNWNYAGVQLGLPFATSTTVMYYNKTLLDAAGVPAPDTFADIITVAAAMPETTADGQPLTTYAAIPNTPTLANWLGQLGSYVVDFNNGSEGSAAQLVCLDNGALVTFLTEWKAMYAAGALKNESGSTDAFVAGQLVLMTSSSSNVNSVLAKVDGAFEVGVAAYPRVNADAAAGATVSGSCVVMFDAGEARRAAAWTFVQYLTSPEVQAAFAAGTGYVPSNTAAVETDAYQALLAQQPAYAVAMDQLAATPADMRSVTVGPSKDFYYAIQDCVSEMLTEDLSPEETADIMADELNGLLHQYHVANP